MARIGDPGPSSRDAGLFRPLTDTAEAQREWATGANPRIPLGFPILDSRCQGGPARGEVVIFTAYSGVGKTIFAANVAVNTLGVPTLFFSLEMQGHFLLNRLAAIYNNTPTQFIENQLRQDGRSDLVDRFVATAAPSLAIVDTPGLGMKKMSVAMTQASEAWGRPVQLAIIDYLELVSAGLASGGVEQIDTVSRRLKDWARQHDCVVVVLHQTNLGGSSGKQKDRKANGFSPLTRRDLRFGGDVAADYSLTAYRPYLDPELSPEMMSARQPEFYIQFLKTRGGSEIHPQGVNHHLDVHTLRLTPPQQLVQQLNYQQEEAPF